MRSFIVCSLLLTVLCSVPGCNEELAQAETWEDTQVASYIGSGSFLEENVPTVTESPVRYRWVQKCNGNSCEWVQQPIPDSISTPQATVVRSYSSSSYRATPLRALGGLVRGLFSHIRSRFSRGC